MLFIKPASIFSQLTGRSRRLFALPLLLALALSSCGGSNSGQNNAIEMSDYAGRWLILNYWAEWCTPCLKEIPELNALHKQYSDQLAVVAVNFDGVEGEELSKLVERMNLNVDIAEIDPADQLRLSRPASLPTTYIFGKDGTMQAKLVGPQTKESLLQRTVHQN